MCGLCMALCRRMCRAQGRTLLRTRRHTRDAQETHKSNSPQGRANTFLHKSDAQGTYKGRTRETAHKGFALRRLLCSQHSSRHPCADGWPRPLCSASAWAKVFTQINKLFNNYIYIYTYIMYMCVSISSSIGISGCFVH